MIICGIYKITNPKGKIYIGQSEDIYKRWKNYYKLSCNKQIKLYRSLKKYRPKNHKFEILEKCEFENLDCIERYWQDFYDVLNRKKGLNLLLTSCKNKTKKYSKESSIKLSNSLKLAASKKIKPIYQYNLNGELIRIWKNTWELKNKTNFGIQYIRSCCNGFIDKAYEYLWRNTNSTFEKEFLDKVKITMSEKMKGHKFNLGKKRTIEQRKKMTGMKGFKHSDASKLKMTESKLLPIIQYDKNMNKIKEWSSAKEAGLFLGKSPQNISSCCSNVKASTHSAYGFKWKYKN
jgi:group I intron endonuclease